MCRKRDDVRPTQMGMVKTNPAPHFRAVTRIAISNLPDPSAPPKEFPDKAVETLVESTRGMQPTMAALPLALATERTDLVGTGFELPLFTNELFFWLVLGVYPFGGKRPPKLPNKKPTMDVKPLRHMFRKVADLRKRVNSTEAEKATETETGTETGTETPAPEGPFSATDIEKIAYVIGHMDVSPYKHEHVPPKGWEEYKIESLGYQTEEEYASALLLQSGARSSTMRERGIARSVEKGEMVPDEVPRSMMPPKKRKRDDYS